MRTFKNHKTIHTMMLTLLLVACAETTPTGPEGDNDPGGGGVSVGPGGGQVVSPDGLMTLDIPAGALDTETEITVTLVDRSDLPESLAADVIGSVYHVEPQGLALATPATVEVDLSGATYPSKNAPAEIPATVLAGIQDDVIHILDEQSMEADLDNGTRLLSAHPQYLESLVVLFDGSIRFEAEIPEEVPGDESSFDVILSVQHGPEANHSPVLFYDHSGTDVVYLDDQGKTLFEIDGADGAASKSAAVRYRCRTTRPTIISSVKIPGYTIKAWESEGPQEVPLEFFLIRSLRCGYGSSSHRELTPSVSSPKQAWTPGMTRVQKQPGSPAFCEGIPPEDCVVVTGRGFQVIDADADQIVNNNNLPVPMDLIGSVHLAPPAGITGPNAWEHILGYGVQGFTQTAWVDGGWGLTQLVSGHYTDISVFDGVADGGGAMIVDYGRNMISFLAYQPDGSLGSDIPITSFDLAAAEGRAISAVARTASTAKLAGSQVLVLTDLGEVLAVDRSVGNAASLVGMAGTESRSIRMAGDLVFVTNFESDDVSIFRWNTDNTVTPLDTVPVGDGPIQLDTLQLADGNFLAATQGLNDGTYTLIEVTPEGSLVDVSIQVAPGDCDEPSYAALIGGSAVQVLVTCFDSGRVALIDAP